MFEFQLKQRMSLQRVHEFPIEIRKIPREITRLIADSMRSSYWDRSGRYQTAGIAVPWCIDIQRVSAW